METEILITVLVVAALVVLALLVWRMTRRKKQRAHLQDHFGHEYDRTVDRADSKRDGEKKLAEREEARERIELRPLTGEENRRYQSLWDQVQATFVDRPEGAVREADELVGEVMRARGYPVDDFDQRADILSVDHPQVVEHYRHAHAVAERDVKGDVSTEDRRQAFVHFRSLFEMLLQGEKEHHTV